MTPTLDQKINEHFPGHVVRKDLTAKVKGNAVVPTYVLEYLLGQYCATDDEDSIEKRSGKCAHHHQPALRTPGRKEVKALLEFAIESRRRVKLQLMKMDETFREREVHFAYQDLETGQQYLSWKSFSMIWRGKCPKKKRPLLLRKKLPSGKRRLLLSRRSSIL